MRVKGNEEMHVCRYSSFAALPGGYAGILGAGAGESFFLSREWFRSLEETTLEAGESLLLFGAELDDGDATPCALLACRWAAGGGSGWLTSFTTFYSLEFAPLLRPDAECPERALEEIVRSIARVRPRCTGLKLDALDRRAPWFERLVQSLRRQGFAAFPIPHFGNWYEEVHGRSFEDYLSQLPRSLRRLARRFDRSEALTCRVIDNLAGLEQALEDYQRVYEASWKEPERFRRFMPCLLRTAAQMGVLRLGLLYVEGEPAAAEVYVLANGKATSFKTCYDGRFSKLGPGSILSLQLIRRLINVDRVREIDFGSGDEAYKQEWMSARRERWAIVAFNLRTLRGLLGAARHVLGLVVRRLAQGVSVGPRRRALPLKASGASAHATV